MSMAAASSGGANGGPSQVECGTVSNVVGVRGSLWSILDLIEVETE